MNVTLCSLCETRPATTSYGFPVCDECRAGLEQTQADLAALEAADPVLAALGERAELAAIEMAEAGGALTPEDAEAMRRRLGEPRPVAAQDAIDKLRSGDRPADWDAEDHALADGVEMIGRCGARSLQIGYLVDDPPPGAANWYAEAEYRRGTMVTEPQMTPVAAVETLVSILQRDATCSWCGRVIAWGERPPRGDRRPRCWWRKIAGRWEKGCPRRDAPMITERP